MPGPSLRRALAVASRPLRVVNRLLPKRADRVVIYSNLGFHGNDRALYEHIVAAGLHRRYRIVCVTNVWRRPGVAVPAGVRFVAPWVGLFYFLTSRYFFYTLGKYPIPPAPSQVVVNLWHGMPLKTIGNLERPGSITEQYFTSVLDTSPFFAPIMAAAFACPRDAVLIAAQPRTDDLFRPDCPPELSGHRRLVCWLPTFRTSTYSGWVDSARDVQLPFFSPGDDALAALDEALAALDTLLVVKFHPLQVLDDGWRDLGHVRFYPQSRLDESGANLYRLLGCCDALITDFSSVYVDYLLLDRPMAFAYDDLDEYRAGRGFVFDDPTAYLPGPQVGGAEDLLAFVESLDGTDEFASRRRELAELFHTFPGDGACARLLAEVGIEG